ncbi:unnamed protein product [Brachionus calyciflorus]|uniref:Uncharacterized protein n=1 Tax=Brachionus calyciflorus TaxID=104777 RepID=A0A813U158_9BILA|nr:unnamed protein product [Brachionus calyciflorus]
MEAQKLVAIDIDSLTTTTNTSMITSNVLSNVRNKSSSCINRHHLLNCLTYSKTFRDLLSLYDEQISNDEKLLAIMCDSIGITEQHKIKIYLNNAKNKENFLKNFFNDCSDQIRNFQAAIEYLRQFEQANFLVQCLEKEENTIYNQIEERCKSANDFQVMVTITDKNGKTIELIKSSSQSSISNSSTDSDRTPNIHVLLVYYTEQLGKNLQRITKFKEQLRKSNIFIIDFDLSKKEDIKSEFQKFELYPVFLIYDKNIDNLLDFTQKQFNERSKNISNFYLQIYFEYLRTNYNRRFYLFTLDKFDEYCCPIGSSRFKYPWLLRKILMANNEEQHILPPSIPLYETEAIDIDLAKFLKYFERIARPF